MAQIQLRRVADQIGGADASQQAPRRASEQARPDSMECFASRDSVPREKRRGDGAFIAVLEGVPSTESYHDFSKGEFREFVL